MTCEWVYEDKKVMAICTLVECCNMLLYSFWSNSSYTHEEHKDTFKLMDCAQIGIHDIFNQHVLYIHIQLLDTYLCTRYVTHCRYLGSVGGNWFWMSRGGGTGGAYFLWFTLLYLCSPQCTSRGFFHLFHLLFLGRKIWNLWLHSTQ